VAIQRVELSTDVAIHCPFCGQLVVDNGEDAEDVVLPCPHTLFFATDGGFEFRSPEFNTNLGLTADYDDCDSGENGFDQLTDKVDIPDAVKFVTYVGPPSFFGAYVAFAPKYDHE